MTYYLLAHNQVAVHIHHIAEVEAAHMPVEGVVHQNLVVVVGLHNLVVEGGLHNLAAEGVELHIQVVHNLAVVVDKPFTKTTITQLTTKSL